VTAAWAGAAVPRRGLSDLSRFAMRFSVLVVSLLLELGGGVAARSSPAAPPRGTIVWSNASLGSLFAANSLALPNGDVLLVAVGASGLTEDLLTLKCVSHQSGATLWSAPIAAPSISFWPGLKMMVGPRYGAAAAASGDGSAPVVVLTYGNGMNLNSMQVRSVPRLELPYTFCMNQMPISRG
jgi:hypothetical protein